MIGKMMVIIFGEDRAEYCSVKRKMKDKHFFDTRHQLYRVYPQGLSRCRIDNFGEEYTSSEVVCYAENEIIPYIIKGDVDYSANSFCMDIDEHKLMAKDWFGKPKISFMNGNGPDLGFLKKPSTWLFIVMGIMLAPILLPMAIDFIGSMAGGMTP